MTLNVIDGAVFSIVAVDGGDRIYCTAFPIHFTRVIKSTVSTEQAGRVTAADCNYLGMFSARLRGQSTDPARDLPVRGSTLVISIADAIFVDTENLSPEQSHPN